MPAQNDGRLARLMAIVLVSTGPLVDEDVDAEINRRLVVLMDAEEADKPHA